MALLPKHCFGLIFNDIFQQMVFCRKFNVNLLTEIYQQDFPVAVVFDVFPYKPDIVCCEKLGSKIEQFVNQLSQSTLNCIHFHFVTFLFFRTHCKVSLPLCQGTYIGFIANEKITFYCSLTLLTQAALAHRVVQIYSLHLVLITEADISISELH